MEKVCKHCLISKPLTIENWLPRKESKDGFRGTCRECWYKQQRPNKRRYYANNRDEILEERKAKQPPKVKIEPVERNRQNSRVDYEKNKEKRQAADRAYYAKNRDAINERQRQRRAANLEFYRLREFKYKLWNPNRLKQRSSQVYQEKHSDEILAKNRERYGRLYRPANSLDYGWTKALAHDRRELKLWKDRTYAEICKQEAIEFIELLEKRLSPVERTILDCLVDANFDAATAADMMSVSIHDFTDTLTAIRQVAVQVRSTEWMPGFWTW